VLDKATSDSFSVAYATGDGTALAGGDYLGASGALTFGAGETVKHVTIALPHDDKAEPVEMFKLTLGALSGNAAGMVDVVGASGLATIGAHGATPKSMPSIRVDNPVVGEAATYVDFVVSLDAPSQHEVSVYYGTLGMSALSGSSNDFFGDSGKLVFAPGTTTQTVRIAIHDDLAVERLEAFQLNLSSATNAVIANASGTALLVDNDTLADSAHHAGLSVRDVIVDASADTVTFAVVLDKAASAGFGVDYRTVDGSATAGSDYLAASGTLTFGAGETVKHVTVALPHDGAAEAAELFNLVLGTVSGAAAGMVDIARGAGHATIGAHGATTVAMPLVSVGDLTVGERDGYAEFVVSLSAPSTSTVSVYYGTVGASAVAGSSGDFLGDSGQLVFAPGVTTQVVRIVINSDNLAEQAESFRLQLSSATNATIGKAEATATIVDGASWHALSGGAGLDVVTYAGARADYVLTRVDGGFTVAARDGGGGTDQLSGIERLRFADAGVALDVDAGGTGGQAYRIYQAAFNRTPDAEGLSFWMNAMDKGVSLTDVAAGFMRSEEFVDIYGAAPSNVDLVSKIYLNVLHRAAEPTGLAYWTSALDQHLVTAAQALGMISESAENQAAVATIIGNGFSYQPFG
jgi:post-segregation antitoxin (ccd killing protein)